MSSEVKRSPEGLAAQVSSFWDNMAGAVALDLILKTDPLFAKFLEQECGLDLSLIESLSIEAWKARSTIKQTEVTLANAEKFLAENLSTLEGSES